MQGKTIAEQILLDAKLEASAIMKQANESVEKDNQEFEDFKSNILKDNKDRLQEKSADIKDMSITQADEDGQKRIYSEKKSILLELKDKALQELNALPHKSKIKLVDIILNKHATLGDKVLVKIDGIKCKDIEALEIAKSLSLHVEEGINYGVIILSKTVDKNFSFSSMIDEVETKNESEIYSLLFD